MDSAMIRVGRDVELVTTTWATFDKIRKADRDVVNDSPATSGLVPVRTSLGTPRWFGWAKATPYLGELAPYGLIDQEDQDEFERLYVKRLEKAGVEKIAERLLEIHREYGGSATMGRPLALLCYENLQKPGKWCHRTMFAAWWERETDQKVPELDPEPLLVPSG